MEANSYFGLGLAADLAACICFRKSRLMLASNFLVGTLFSSLRFSFWSKTALLQLKTNFRFWLRFRTLKVFQHLQHVVDKLMIRTSQRSEPYHSAIRALLIQVVEFCNRNGNSTLAFRTLQFKSCDVRYFDCHSLFSGHIASGVML